MFLDRFRAAAETCSSGAVEALYAPDALLDANVPVWRFQRKGLEEIRAQLEEWYRGTDLRIDGREWLAPFGAVMETEERLTMEGAEVYSRVLHVLFAEDGTVARHILYCTGPWDEALVARHRAEAPIYEP